ncbi:hypothetical protein AC579_6807, partial [Pseudocercospora musae]
LPVVTETYDGYLNDLSQFAVKPEHIARGIENASSDPVPEGNKGGGTAMICHGYKGGNGSSSRIVPGMEPNSERSKNYAIGVLVQANYGRARDLRIGGVPVGRLLQEQHGLSRVGGYGHNLSGDIFLAFSTANENLPGLENVTTAFKPRPFSVDVLDDMTINGLFEATADATEEAIYNALCQAETMVGLDGHRVEALPLAQVKNIMSKYL